LFFTFEIPTNSKINSQNIRGNNNIFRIWALSDIQPRSPDERNAFKNAISDINNNIKEVNFSIVAGDIVNTTDEEIFDWYIAERNKSYIKTWYEIIGNHDLKNDNGKLFRNKLRNQLNYSLTVDNMIYIFMSDALKSRPTDISDETFKWWKNLVINNQDKIITVVTHAPLEGSNIPFSEDKDRQILDSNRFRQVLKQYKVDLWLSGHLHLPNEFTNTLNRNENLNDIIFVHISSIRPEFLGLKHSQSRFIEFLCGENMIRIKSRDHQSGKWNDELEKSFIISKVVECN
jgi:3',5'-cyclic AMP phosphodiesterase CpdA